MHMMVGVWGYFICLPPFPLPPPSPQATQEQQLDCALDLMRRLPPQQIEKNLSDLIDLVSASPTPISAHPPLGVVIFSENTTVCATLTTVHIWLCVIILEERLSVPQVPSLCEDLLSSVDQPLKIARDKETGKDYLLCDYNRDGDSYRSAVPPLSGSLEGV